MLYLVPEKEIVDIVTVTEVTVKMLTTEQTPPDMEAPMVLPISEFLPPMMDSPVTKNSWFVVFAAAVVNVAVVVGIGYTCYLKIRKFLKQRLIAIERNVPRF